MAQNIITVKIDLVCPLDCIFLLLVKELPGTIAAECVDWSNELTLQSLIVYNLQMTETYPTVTW